MMRTGRSGAAATRPAPGPCGVSRASCVARRAGMRAALAAALAVALASCAPRVAPTPPPAPPTTTPERPTPRPAPVTPPPVETTPRWTLAREPLIDVGLVWDVDTLSFAPTEAVQIVRSGPDGVVPLGSTAQAVRVLGSSKGLHVATGEGARFSVTTADTILFNLDPEHLAEARLRWRRHLWRGAFKLFVNPRGRLTLAARVPLEAYLVGVVPGEIGALSDELLEAGRAQAISARSYTLFYLGRRAKEGFDLYATVEDQVYGPTDSETALATQCVETTRALVALSNEQPIRANYSSTCGGITAEVWESWPAERLPYLLSQRDRMGDSDFCAASRHHRWEERFTPDEFVRNLRRFAPERGVPVPKGGVGRLLDVRVAKRSLSGRVWRLDVVTSTGRIEIPGRELRWVLRRAGMPGSILRSTLIKVDVRRNRVTKEPIEVIVSGAGNGHGVGLCQTGALGMARAGIKAEKIIEHYYAGVEIRPLF